jgi:flagellar biosynthetic protein FlhB
MADHDRTEKPTAKRRREARKEGQVARSTDLSGATVLLAGLAAITMLGPGIVSQVAAAMRETFARAASPGQVSSASGLSSIGHSLLDTLIGTVAPLAGACVAVALLTGVLQVGFRPSVTALKPDFKRINPAAGAKNIFGTRILFETGKSLVKVAVVGAVAAMALLPQLTHLGASVGTTPGELGVLMGASARGIAERAGLAYLVIGVVDYLWQRRRHEKALKMTKQQVKDESKQQALPPEVRSAIRRRQLQAARARMMAAIPQADVVVTNPTHFAVALSYDGTHPAPVLVAKGQDLVAAQIRRIAAENNVPVVENPPLARQLHATVEIGQMIPAEVYQAVAQVLAFVYRMAGRSKLAAGAR